MSDPKITLRAITEELMSLHDTAFVLGTKSEGEIERRLHSEVIVPLKGVLAMSQNLDSQFSLKKVSE